jgi:hypothetical protein
MLLRDRRRYLRLPRRAWRMAGVIVLFVGLADSRGMPWYDTGIYHLQAVQWITSGPLPRGLGNLYGSFGYNCAWFTLAGAIETPLLLGKACFVINALLAILLALPAVDSVMRGRGRPLQPYRVMLGLMLIPWALFGIRMVSSLAPDPAVMLIILFSTALWIRSVRFAPHALALACFAMTIKLSAAPLLAAALAARSPRGRRGGAPVAAFCAAAAAIFLARGIWLSGYPAFPSTIGRFAALSWTATPQSVFHAEREIKYWSRYRRVYEVVKPGAPWIGAWVSRIGFSPPMVIAAVVFIAGGACWFYRRPRFTAAGTRSALALLAMLAAIIFWFLTAPQPRFGYGYLFGAASLTVAMGLSGFVPGKIDLPVRRIAFAGGIIALLVLTRLDLHLLKAALFRWPAIARATLKPHRTIDGVIVYMPVGDDRVWAAPLPATPELDPGLRCESDASGRIRRFWVEKSSSDHVPR